MGLSDRARSLFGDSRKSASEPTEGDRIDAEDWEFAWSQHTVEAENGWEVRSIGEDEHEQQQVFAGPDARELIEDHREYESPVVVGVDSKPSDLADFAPIPRDRLDKHMGLFGASGSGKSVILGNFAQQLFYGGEGMFVLDGGDEAALIRHLLKRVPPHRRDDVVIIDPGADDGRSEYATGFNLLQIDVEPGEPGYESAVNSRQEVLVETICGEHGGGAIIESVSDTMIRIAATTEINFTIADIRYVIASEDSRERFKQLCDTLELDKEFLDFYERIATMDQDSLNALERRLKNLVEDPRSMRVISDRHSDLSFETLMDEQKIVFFNLGLGSRLKSMLSQVVQQRYWSIVEARSQRTLAHKRPMSFLVIDEAHDVINENGFGQTSGTRSIRKLLADGRKKDAGVVICTQRPRQLPQDVIEEMAGNADTIISLRLEEDKDQCLVSKLLDIDQEWMRGEGDFMGRMSTKDSAKRERAATFRFYSLPEYPPFLTDAECEQFYHENLEENGSRVLSNEEINEELLFHGGSGLLERMAFQDYFEANDITYNEASIGRGITEEGDDAELDSAVREARELARQTLYESIYAVQIKRDCFDEAVPVEAVMTEWERRADALGVGSMLAETSLSIEANMLEQLPGVEREPRDGQVMAWLTQEGFEDAGLAQDTGSSASGGSHAHRMVLTQAFHAFTKLDLFVSLPTQEGDSLPDGVAKLPIDPMDAKNFPAVRAKKRRLREEYPALYELTDGRHVSIEAETSTPTAPEQMLTNLRKAVTKGDLCVFATKDASASKGAFDYWPRRCEKVLYDTYRKGSETKIDDSRLTFARSLDDNDNRTFYNKKKAFFRLSEGTYALRRKRDTEIRWVEDRDEIVLRDTGDRELGRFDGPAAVADPSPANVEAYYEYDQSEGEYVVYAEGEKSYYGSKDELEAEWSRIQAPFIPENEFVDEAGTPCLPTEEDWVFVIFPDADNEEYDQPQLYESGEVRPLLESTADEGSETLPSEQHTGSSETSNADPVDDGQDRMEAPSETSRRTFL